MSNATLVVRDLQVSYGAVNVLRDASLRVAAGEVVALVGPNSAGKTTTLKAISGVVQRQGGSVLWDGQDLPMRPDAVAASGIIHVPEGRGLMASLTIEQNLRFGAAAVGRRLRTSDLSMVTDCFPALNRLLHRRAGSLSGGEQQMAAIGRGLVANPSILMVDELSLGLAPRIVSEVLSQLVEVAREKRIGMLLVDQNVRALSAVCDSTYALTDRSMHLVDGSDEEFLRSVYLGNDVDLKLEAQESA